MKLTLKKPHLSIQSFPDTDLPDFTLITGVNGVGKSHFLQAIQEGRIACDLITNPADEVRLFDWTTLVPQASSTADSYSITQQTLSDYSHLQTHRGAQAKKIEDTAITAGVPGEYCTAAKLTSMTPDELTQLVGHQNARQVANQIERRSRLLEEQIRGQIPQISMVVERAGKNIFALEQDDFRLVPNWGAAKLFQQGFAKLFVSYRDLLLFNRMKKLAESEEGISKGSLSPSEFRAQYGPPPWEFVDAAMQAAQLDFSIEAPNEFSVDAYEPKLRKRSNGAIVPFHTVSSGEKILIALAYALYYARDSRQQVAHPKLLLLDEIDAPLHPAMAKSFLGIVQHTLVGEYGMKVIATTHSSSTVAMGPESALYTMRHGEPGLQKATKAQALNQLTVGVPTLAITAEGRRQVFVEGPNDEQAYQSMFRSLRQVIASERSLEFVSPAIRSKHAGSDMHSGCTVVRQIVESLRTKGVESVFGLVDWDGSQNTTDTVVVLAEGSRNGLENLLLDPLLIASLLKWSRGRDVFVAKGLSYVEFLSADKETWQQAIADVEAKIFPSAPLAADARYVGGFELRVVGDHLQMDDHELENLVLANIPELRAYSQRAGSLMLTIANTIVADKPDFTPIEVVQAFERLLGS